jgi:alpha-N-arabinofuranosidase
VSGEDGSAQQANRPVAMIDASQTGVPIDPLVCGKFTELLANMFEKGVWAEMISDRKFFYQVDNSEQLTPRNTRRQFNRWRPVGPDGVVTMDTELAYVGEYSPRISLNRTTPRGVVQGGIPLRGGKEYVGRVILAGDPGAAVTVSLIWGDGANGRQTIAIPQLADMYNRYPLRFVAGADTDNARFEITGTGTGTFLIGTVSLMPADNLSGFRADIVEHLKVIDHGTVYRWPGGNMLAAYDWRDGVGDIDRRPPRYDVAWNALEDNDVGTDEFMTLCRLLELEPYIVVNIGLHDEYSAAAWVEYCNGAPDTRYGSMRADNGHREPFNVIFWGIGNEMYGQWQYGHMSIGHYVVKHNRFAVKMRQVDPSIKLVGCGANIFETGTTNRHHRLRPDNMRLPFEYGSPEDWSGQLLRWSLDHMDIIAEHVYPYWGHAYDETQQGWVTVTENEADRARRGANRVRAIAEAMDYYNANVPGLKEKGIRVAIDEWAVSGPVGAAEGLLEIVRRPDVFELGGYTSFMRCISHNAHDTTFSPTGLVFRMFREHYGTIPVQLTGNSPQKELPGTVGVDKPSVSSGSETYPLDMAAALSSDRRTLTVALLNPTETTQEVGLRISGVSLDSVARAWQMIMPQYYSRNVPGEEMTVDIEGIPVQGSPGSLSVPPISITVYAFGLR